MEEAQKITNSNAPLYRILATITKADPLMKDHAERIQKMIADGAQVPEPFLEEIE